MTDIDDDWDDSLMYEGKEEPDCYSCSDAGCPACGQVDPTDPEHLRYLASEIITGRAAQLPALTKPATDAEIGAVFLNLPADAAVAVQELIATAMVTITAVWPPAGGYSDEMPF